MTKARKESSPMETPKPEPSGGDGEKRPARANRGRDPKSTRCEDLPPGSPVAHVLRFIAEGAVGYGVDIAQRLGLCADDTCGAFDSVSPFVIGATMAGLEAIYRLVRCRFWRRSEGSGENAALTPEAEQERPSVAEKRDRRIVPPTPSQVKAAAHRPDAIVVPEEWFLEPIELGPVERGDCGGFDPKAPIILDDGTLLVPSPCPPGGGDGCSCDALAMWVARARASLEAVQHRDEEE